MDIAVNLATHNRAAFLEKCLLSLCAQTLEPSRYEICVVANACTDDTLAVVDKIAAAHPRHRIFAVEEPIPGLSRARNTGLRATTAALVAHIDDDGSVYPDWLARFIDCFRHHGDALAIVGGEIEPQWAVPKPDWLTARMQCFLSAGMGLGDVPRFLAPHECAAEGNSCYRRTALEQAGFFPVELGRVGNTLLSGESIVELRIRQQGGRVFFDPAIILRHHIHADRLRPLWFRQRFFWQGVSSVAVRAYEARHGAAVPRAGALRLPLARADWDFLTADTEAGLEESLAAFEGLGFVLAHSGIIGIEGVE